MNSVMMKVQGVMVGAVILAGAWSVGLATAQTPGDLEVSANDMLVTATFTRSTPCTPYTLTWGDGEEVVYEEEEASDFCIQVIDIQELEHEYVDEGEYTVTLMLGENEFTTEVVVPGETIAFDLQDVETITSVWVDPSEQMADEEYYVHTITLTDGTEATVRVAGFTTIEIRNEQFTAAGFTGDVDELLAMVEPVGDDTNDPTSDSADLGVYLELIDVLQTLIEKLTLLLEQ